MVGFVPDGGHKRLIELCLADKSMRTVVLTTEEEGIGLAAGAWLGGARERPAHAIERRRQRASTSSASSRPAASR